MIKIKCKELELINNNTKKYAPGMRVVIRGEE